MKILIIISLIICIIALILTLVAMKATDTNYSSEKSVSSLSFMYILLIPVVIIGGIIAWIAL